MASVLETDRIVSGLRGAFARDAGRKALLQYAADRIQWYDTYKGLPSGAFDFGRWEGTLYKFTRAAPGGVRKRKAPLELAAFLAGFDDDEGSGVLLPEEFE